MSLVGVELPSPEAMRGPWAATAAVMAAIGYGSSCYAAAEAGLWHYDDGGGNWANLRLLDGGRAVLYGHDHEYSDTYFADAAEYFGEEATDLLAGAPPWWAEAVEGYKAFGDWLGFVYGYQDGAWSRADYDVADGFAALDHPAADPARCRDLIGEFTDGHATGAAVDALVAADGDVDEALVAAAVPAGRDVAAGVAAARRFLPR